MLTAACWLTEEQQHGCPHTIFDPDAALKVATCMIHAAEAAVSGAVALQPPAAVTKRSSATSPTAVVMMRVVKFVPAVEKRRW